MNINQELVEKVKAGTHCIANRHGTVEQLNKVLKKCLNSQVSDSNGFCDYYWIDGEDWIGGDDNDLRHIWLSDFFLPTPKTIPVEELEAVMNEQLIGCNKLKEDLQTLINKYK